MKVCESVARPAIARASYLTVLTRGIFRAFAGVFRLAEVRVPLTGDAVAKLFERAGRPLRRREAVAQRARERLAELVQGAPEELARGLEFRAEAEEAEAVVTRHIEPAAELI